MGKINKFYLTTYSNLALFCTFVFAYFKKSGKPLFKKLLCLNTRSIFNVV